VSAMRFSVERDMPRDAPRPCPAVIRPARRSDVDGIALLWQEMMALHFDLDSRFRFVADAPTAYARHIRRSMSSRRAHVAVAEASGRIVGYVLAELHERPPIYPVGIYSFISDLCVEPSQRQRGIGRALFRAAWRWALSCGVTAVELYAAERNPTAFAFWQAMGFSPYLRLMRREAEDPPT